MNKYLKPAKAAFMALCLSLSLTSVAMADNLYSEKLRRLLQRE